MKGLFHKYIKTLEYRLKYRFLKKSFNGVISSVTCHFYLFNGWSLKFGFLKSHLIMNAPLTISSHHFWVGVTVNPPKSDDGKWSTDKGAFMIK